MVGLLFHPFGQLLQFRRVGRDLFLEPLGIASQGSEMHHGPQIAISFFGKIQLRGIGGEKEEFDVLRVIFQPLLDHSGMMDPQIVQNQKDLPLRILDQLLEEFREHLRVHAVRVNHEPNFSLVGDR